MHPTPPPADLTPAADLLRLWREALKLAQEFDEVLLVTPSESFDFVVLGRARRHLHKAARVLGGRLQVGPSGRAIAQAGAPDRPLGALIKLTARNSRGRA
jgi:hypothetical protein